MDRSFYLENFGCRATQADVVVLNTCTVTSSADQDARATIRRIHRENPRARILVTGCYAQRAPEEIAQIPGVSVVVGNSHKGQLADIAGRHGFVSLQSIGSAAGEIVVGDIFAHTELMAAPVFDADTASEKTRPNLKVQDGCNNRCSFCIIPYVRGKSRSLKLDEVIRETQALVGLGYKEIVLSGINLGRWGRDIEGRARFIDLLRAILSETEIARIRISSVEPMDWSDDLIELVASSPRICKHAHVPLQSGSDRILRKMHRKYRPWHYADRIQKIRADIPIAAIGADVMVGFPGETDADFEETRAFIESLPFTYLHVFTYSSRPGTPSASMPNQVRGDVTRERNRILRELAARKKREFQEQFLGRELQAITLTNIENGRTEALTDNYQKLWLEGRHDSNLLVTPTIIGIDSDALIGTLFQFQ